MTTRQTLEILRRYESRNVTFIEADGSWPMVWDRARGVHVWDAEGKRYLDLTAAFGVATAGHANPRVVRAGQKQMAKLLHAMGDVHPHALKAKLARELSRITFERWSAKKPEARSPKPEVASGSKRGKVIFCNSGFEAVEAALKTAMLATGKREIISFTGGYHGLGYGALNATHREHFRGPFRKQLGQFGRSVAFPTHAKELPAIIQAIKGLLKRGRIGAILVEPIQVRGGVNIPPHEFLPALRRLCDAHGVLLILDEIYTGFGRTGKWFACELSSTIPDLICLGKAMTGGFPLSACVGRAEIMDSAWPVSTGEAIHTSTFLGHPVGCAMALAQIQEIRDQKLVQRGAELGDFLLNTLRTRFSSRPDITKPDTNGNRLQGIQLSIRGLGLLAGLEMWSATGSPATTEALKAIKTMLGRGFVFLPEGEHANVISFTPPLTISKSQLQTAVKVLGEVLEVGPSP
jgi:4-aminobutyrate aminotransferase-like enzyme